MSGVAAADPKAALSAQLLPVRLISSLVIALFLGWFPVTGAAGLAIWAILSGLSNILFVRSKHNPLTYETDLGVTNMDIFRDHFMDGLGTVVLVWSLVYTFLWFD